MKVIRTTEGYMVELPNGEYLCDAHGDNLWEEAYEAEREIEQHRRNKMKAWEGVVITTYQEVLTVLADTKEQAEVLMYDRANPMGDGYSGEMVVHDLKEVGESK